MAQNQDYADSEVKGLARYIPTALSKGILLLLPGVTWLSFSSIREHPEWFLIQSNSPLEQTLVAAVVSLLLSSFLILVLVLDMAFAVHHSKHRRIVQYSNEHPAMSLKFIIQNASSIHWLSLGFLCATFFSIGYVIAKT